MPGSSSVDKEPLTRELRRLLSRLNETSGGFSKMCKCTEQRLIFKIGTLSPQESTSGSLSRSSVIFYLIF